MRDMLDACADNDPCAQDMMVHPLETKKKWKKGNSGAKPAVAKKAHGTLTLKTFVRELAATKMQFEVDIVKAEGLKAADKGRGGARASDPFCVVHWNGKEIGRTEVGVGNE